MNCSQCGTEITLNAKFCHKCGVAIQIDKPAVTQNEYLLGLKKLVKFPHVNMPAKIRTFFSVYHQNKRLVVLFISIGLLGLVLLISQILWLSTERCYENPDQKCILSIAENIAATIPEKPKRIEAYIAIAERNAANNNMKSARKNIMLAKTLLLSSGAKEFEKNRLFYNLIKISDVEILIDDKINAESTLREAIKLASSIYELQQVAKGYIKTGNLKTLEEIIKLSQKFDGEYRFPFYKQSDRFLKYVAKELANYRFLEHAILITNRLPNDKIFNLIRIRRDPLYEIAEAQLKENNISDLPDIINQLTEILILEDSIPPYFARLALIQYKYKGEQSANELLENSLNILVRNAIRDKSDLSIIFTKYSLASAMFQILKGSYNDAIFALVIAKSFANKIKKFETRDFYLGMIIESQIKVKDFSNALITANMINSQKDQAKALTSIARSMIEMGLKKDAQEILNKAVDISNTFDIEDRLYSHYQISELLAETGDYKKALEIAIKSDSKKSLFITIDRNMTNIVSGIASTGQFKEALEIANKLDPSKRIDALRTIILEQARAGDYKNAFESAYKLNDLKNYFSSIYSILHFRIREKDFDTAKNIIKHTLKYINLIDDQKTHFDLLIDVVYFLHQIDKSK